MKKIFFFFSTLMLALLIFINIVDLVNSGALERFFATIMGWFVLK